MEDDGYLEDYVLVPLVLELDWKVPEGRLPQTEATRSVPTGS